MALGIIQFLLGGKNNKSKTKETQTSAVSAANFQNKNNTNNNANQQNQDLKDIQQQSQNNNNSNQQTTNQEQNNSSQNEQQQTSSKQSSGNKKSVSEVLMKMHKEMKDSNERITGLVTDIKKIENTVSSLTSRVEELDKKSKETDSKIKEFDNNMSQFLSLYELINNQYNPFVSQEDIPKKVNQKPTEEEQASTPTTDDEFQPLEIEIPQEESNANGTVLENSDAGENKEEFNYKNSDNNDSKQTQNPQELNQPKTISIPSHSNEGKKMSSSLLELDTLNIEEAAADAVPLTVLKNNTNALVIILSWLEYLIKRVGIEETRNTLRYYTETLRWMTPEVFFDLDKYLKGMSDTQKPQSRKTSVKDHIVSLYFISKLNEKSLDEKLTKAVLEIIDE